MHLHSLTFVHIDKSLKHGQKRKLKLNKLQQSMTTESESEVRFVNHFFQPFIHNQTNNQCLLIND